MQIALELDQQERAFMAEGGMESEDYLKYIAEDSGNVAADGNFSVQVCVQGSIIGCQCRADWYITTMTELHAAQPSKQHFAQGRTEA